MSDVRLIDANALKAKLYSLLKIEEAPPMFIEGLETALAVADVAPTIDAVEVVRCRECKYARPFVKEEWAACVMWCRGSLSDGFCHMGAKMDGGADNG